MPATIRYSFSPTPNVYTSIGRAAAENPMIVGRGPFSSTKGVEVSTDGGATWTSIWQQVGDQGNVWQAAQVPLSAANLGPNGELQFRFWFQTGSTAATFEYDVAIDNVCVGPAPFQAPTPEISLRNTAAGITSTGGNAFAPLTTRVCTNTDVCLDFATTLGSV